jgi:hypothetical protein
MRNEAERKIRTRIEAKRKIRKTKNEAKRKIRKRIEAKIKAEGEKKNTKAKRSEKKYLGCEKNYAKFSL